MARCSYKEREHSEMGTTEITSEPIDQDGRQAPARQGCLYSSASFSSFLRVTRYSTSLSQPLVENCKRSAKMQG